MSTRRPERSSMLVLRPSDAVLLSPPPPLIEQAWRPLYQLQPLSSTMPSSPLWSAGPSSRSSMRAGPSSSWHTRAVTLYPPCPPRKGSSPSTTRTLYLRGPDFQRLQLSGLLTLAQTGEGYYCPARSGRDWERAHARVRAHEGLLARAGEESREEHDGL